MPQASGCAPAPSADREKPRRRSRPQEDKPRNPPKRRGRPPKGSGKRLERTGRERCAAPRPGRPQNPAEGDASAAPAKGKRWVRVFDADADRIANSQAPELYCQALAVWYALIREASYRRSLTFEASDSYLSKRLPGMRSRMTVRKATRLLQALGMLTSESRAVPGTKNREPLLRTLHPAAPMPGIGGAEADPDGHGPQEAGELSFI